MPEIIDVTGVSPGNWLLGEHNIARKMGRQKRDRPRRNGCVPSGRVATRRGLGPELAVEQALS